ncbi:MAG: hypothetical protein ACREDT_04545 [Methylocella sp.]
MIGGVGSEKIGPHPRKLLGATAREGLGVFVVETPLVFLPQHQAEFEISGEPPRPIPQLGLERRGILAKCVVEKSDLPRCPCANRPAGQGQLQRPLFPHPPRDRGQPRMSGGF